MSTRAQLQEAARLACYAAYAAYSAALRGDVPTGSYRNFDPVVGQPVVESSTLGLWDDPERWAKGERAHLNDVLNCIGVLERIEEEPICTEEHWRDAESGYGAGPDEPVPKERAWYLRTLDGREFRWVNASFIRVPNSRYFRVMNPIAA